MEKRSPTLPKTTQYVESFESCLFSNLSKIFDYHEGDNLISIALLVSSQSVRLGGIVATAAAAAAAASDQNQKEIIVLISWHFVRKSKTLS